MSAQNVIEFGFDVEAITSQQKQVLALFTDMFDQLSKYDGTRFNPLVGGLADLKKSITDGGQALNAYTQSAQKYNDIVTQQAQKQAATKKTTDDLTAAQKESQRILDQLAATQAKNEAASDDSAIALAKEQQQLKAKNAELRATAQYQSAETDSINQAKAAIAQLTIERNKQNTATDEGIAKIAQLNAEIDQNNEVIKKNSATLEQQKINIGNYAGSMAPAFASVKEQLEGINQQMSAMEQKAQAQNFGRPVVQGFAADQHRNQGPTALAGGAPPNMAPVLAEDADGYAKLSVQAKIYEQLQERQIIGFKTAGQEMRAFKNTLDALEIAGAGNTEGFEKLNGVYTENEQKIKDLHREQTILTGDAPAITALTGVARGLGGVYAAGAGAAQLFATGNEKLDKELNKLVAVMTFLQGLEQATAVLKDKNAIITALETEATKALNFVKGVEASLKSKTKVATEADTAAITLNTAATEESEVANVANTEAIVGMTEATEGAEAATIGLSTALVGTGIGAIIVGVAILVAKIIEWSEAENKAAENSAELAEAMEKVNEVLMARIKLSDEDAEHTKKNLENAMTLSEKNKESYNDINNLKKAQIDLDQKTAENDLKRAANTNDIGAAYRIVDGEVKSLTAGMDPLLTKQAQLNDIANIWLEVQQKKINSSEAYFQIYQKFGTNTDEADAKAQITSLNTQIEATQKLIDAKKQLTGNYNQSQVSQAGLSIDQIQHNNEEERKIALATATTEADYVKSKNAIILADDRSTLAQRLAAIQSNAEQEKKINQANLSNTLTDPANKDSSGNYNAEATGAIQKAAEDRKKITDSAAADTYRTIVEWNDKKLAFINETYNNQLQMDAAVQEALSSNTQKDLEERLNALKAGISDRMKVIQADYALQMTLAKEHNKTQEEIDKIESDRQKGIADLTADTQKKIYDITISWGEKKIKAIEEQNKATDSANAVTTNYNAAEQQLNAHLGKNILSYFTYEGNRKKLDEQYAIGKTAADVKDDQAALARLKEFQQNEIQIRLDAANADLDTARSGGNSDDIAKAQSKVDALKKIQTEGAVDIAAAVKKLGDDTEKNQDATAKAAMQKVQTTIATIKELSTTAAQTMVGLFDAAKDKQIQSIELVTERQDAATDATIAAVQRSTIGQRQASEEVIILSAQKEARDSASKKKEAEDKRAEAIADRDMSIANVVWNTEAAVAKTFAEYGGTPVGFAAAAVVAALGAVEIATIMAKPIPSYAEGIGIPGRGEHPGGHAIVGEAGAELVTLPGHEPFVADQTMLLDMPKGSIVEPLNRNLIADLGGVSMQRAYEMTGWTADRSIEMAIHSQTSAINSQTAQLVRALKKSQKNITKIIINANPLANPDDPFTIKILGRRK